MEPTPLEIQVDLLIAWCEANSADATDLREALTACGIRLGVRCDAARTEELTTIQTNREAALAASGKTVLVQSQVAPSILG